MKLNSFCEVFHQFKASIISCTFIDDLGIGTDILQMCINVKRGCNNKRTKTDESGQNTDGNIGVTKHGHCLLERN